MKNIKMMLVAAIVALVMTSCGSVGIIGAVYHGTTQPVMVTSNVVGEKVGTAKCTSILGIAAFGDGGINAAAREGNIKKISHVDVKTFSVLGIFTTATYYVYGE